MSDSVVYILIGFFIGTIVGGAVVAKRQSKEYDERIEELADERDEARDVADILRKRNEDLLDALRSKDDPDPSLYEHVDYETLSKAYKSPEFDKHFASRVHPKDDEPDDENDENSDLADISADNPKDLADESADILDYEDDDAKDIYLITKEEYFRDLTDRNNESLTYYQEDGVLTDSVGQVIQWQAEVIGADCMEIIDGTDEDTLYVSNDVYDMLYLIHVDHTKSFYSDIYGI